MIEVFIDELTIFNHYFDVIKAEIDEKGKRLEDEFKKISPQYNPEFTDDAAGFVRGSLQVRRFSPSDVRYAPYITETSLCLRASSLAYACTYTAPPGMTSASGGFVPIR